MEEEGSHREVQAAEPKPLSSPVVEGHRPTMTPQDRLNQGQDNEMEMFGYKKKRFRNILCFIGYVFTFGLLRMIFHWRPELDVWCHCVPCSLADAEVILLRTTDEFRKYTRKDVQTIQSDPSPGFGNSETCAVEAAADLHRSLIRLEMRVRYIRVQKTRYVWNPSDGVFQKIGVLDENLSCSDIHREYGLGLSCEEQKARQSLCGANTIEVEITPIWKLLFREILNPVYCFEVYSLSTWLATGYIEYSVAILLMTIISILATLYLLRMQSVKLNRLVESHNNVIVSVLQRNGVVKEVESKYLVPGDVILISEKRLYLPCDALLISGGCVINESMLTGESVPVTKVPLPNVDNGIPWKVQSGENYHTHVLFCGTEVIKTKPPPDGCVQALVLQIGFNTAKGDLVRSILYPKPMNFKLHRELMKVLMGLMGLSVLGVIYTVVISSLSGATAGDLVIMALIMGTTAVPVSLPPALTVCTLYSQTRLKKQGIFCFSPQRIIVCGQLNLFCFDKTGTLTEDGLDLWGIVPSKGNSFQEAVLILPGWPLPWSPLVGAMASCHSLVLMDGKLHGEPLEMKMFEGTGWELKEYESSGSSSSYSIVTPGSQTLYVPVKGFCILHQFPFSSSLQRMSVITKTMGERKFSVFMKGAPEVIVQFCKKETVPDNFSCILDHYTMQGFRVIGAAYKDFTVNEDINVETLPRENVESDLHFLGFLIMENRLKSETKPVLHELESAKIRTIMVTGDNLQTACTVGLSSGMVPDASSLLMLEACEPDGERPATFSSQIVETNRGKSSPQNKSIITTDADITRGFHSGAGKYYYAMSGKTYEVIKQHFPDLVPEILLNGTIFGRMTPKQKSAIIEDLQKIEEGRNTLVTSMCLFKYLILYTLVELVCMLLLFWKQTFLGNYHYLMQDVAITVTVMLTLSIPGPPSRLAPYRPPMSFLSPPLLLSLVLHIIFTIIIQSSSFILVQQQPWYNESHVFSACLVQNESFANQSVLLPHGHSQNFLTTTLWPVSGINLIIAECVFCKGRPFRKPMYTNYMFCILIAAQLVAYLFIMFADIESLYRSMELVCTPYYWRIEMLAMLIILFAASYAVEVFVYNRKVWFVIKKFVGYKSKSRYKKLQWALEKRTDDYLYTGKIPLNSSRKNPSLRNYSVT
ncbi:probable cation-transporting ATPase 13A5 isoform X2 [Dendropsophus ebraccatus]|uniref:probable cation-transporting ATPase 13A5 isoform X2 n=1 Tax=Dendropsophus ebraccatus TaxID=150705 RepID=UPI00383122A0